MALGVFEIEGQECYRCGDKPAHTAPRLTKRGSAELVWDFGLHCDELERAGLDTYPIAPFCQGGGYRRCGNSPTHVVIAGTERGELKPLSLCSEHRDLVELVT